ncbi:FkbM family methyltransferase [uncultured Microscilla sp.]|uniref:FkbM family methyltransferase n=1 Tax=uncultured Microscilla sp. TaxID=432653 RepID=UPI002612DFD7|nr:FkbM family methyltransferase [uncultured Microscilla sp.]
MKKLLPGFIYKFLNEFRRDYIGESMRTFSGEGEDITLRRIFQHLNTGFYVDVGACHPRISSNTHYFYKRGWKGLNIDANPLSIKKYNKLRKRDINVNYGVSNSNDTLDFYLFEEPGINTFSREVYEDKIKFPGVKLIEKMPVKTAPLAEILDKNLPEGQVINFMDVDVEGLDFEVLQSNNWDKYIPEILLVEELSRGKDLDELPIYQFLRKRGYRMIAKTYSTFIFLHRDVTRYKDFIN